MLECGVQGLEFVRVQGTASAVRKHGKASAGSWKWGRSAPELDLAEYRVQVFLRWKRKEGIDSVDC